LTGFAANASRLALHITFAHSFAGGSFRAFAFANTFAFLAALAGFPADTRHIGFTHCFAGCGFRAFAFANAFAFFAAFAGISAGTGFIAFAIFTARTRRGTYAFSGGFGICSIYWRGLSGVNNAHGKNCHCQ